MRLGYRYHCPEPAGRELIRKSDNQQVNRLDQEGMAEIHPKRIRGNWAEGFALDDHTLSSEFIGHDEYGHPQFDTTRSQIGDLLYKLKYKKDKSVIGDIISTASEFIESRDWSIDVLVPVPPSRKRTFQPIRLLAEAIGKTLGIDVCLDCVVKTKDSPELKDVFDFDKRMSMLRDAFEICESNVVGRSVLLFDDLYRSGATLNTVAALLRKNGKAKKLYVLTLTRTRRKR